jgi:copper type II ascorbate-dependent monooxygenase-like protein
MRIALVVAAMGCGGASGPPPPAGDGDADVDSDSDADADSDTGSDRDCARVWHFRSGPDTVAAGEQEYRCYTNAVPADASGWAIRISEAIPAEAEAIVHHLVLMRGDGPGLLGCEPAEFFRPIVFAGGLGTDPLVLPAGAGLAVTPGTSFVMQLHVTNATDEAVDYDVGVDLCLADAVDAEADVVTFGPVDLDIPDDGLEHTFSDTRCAVTGEDRTFFAAYPHMHRLGRHIELALDGDVFAAVPDWDFSDQPTVFADPPRIAIEGQHLSATCTYVNPPGNGTVGFGTRSEDEMCFGFAYYYPAGLERWCADVPGL